MNEPFTVDSKEEIRSMGKGSEIITKWRVWATTKGGTYFHIDFPEKDFVKEKVDKALAAKATVIDSI